MAAAAWKKSAAVQSAVLGLWARQALAKASRQGQTVMLSLDQAGLGDRFAVLMPGLAAGVAGWYETGCFFSSAPRTGIEPVTSPLGGVRSIRLSYRGQARRNLQITQATRVRVYGCVVGLSITDWDTPE